MKLYMSINNKISRVLDTLHLVGEAYVLKAFTWEGISPMCIRIIFLSYNSYNPFCPIYWVGTLAPIPTPEIGNGLSERMMLC